MLFLTLNVFLERLCLKKKFGNSLATKISEFLLEVPSRFELL